MHNALGMLVHLIVYIIENVMLFAFVKAMYNIKTGMAHSGLFIITLSLINFSIGYYYKLFDPNRALSIIIIALCTFSALMICFKINFLNTFICFMFFITIKVVNSLVVLLLDSNSSIMGITEKGMKDLNYFIVTNTVSFIIILVIFMAAKSIRDINNFPKVLLKKMVIKNFTFIIFTLVIGLLNIVYFTYFPEGYKNAVIVLVDLLIITLVIYSYVKATKELEDSRNLKIELDTRNSELGDLNQELVSINEQLKNYAVAVKELAIANERNRMARDIHDALGHKLTMLVKLLEVSAITCENEPYYTKEKLVEAASIARDSLKVIRKSIAELVPEELESNSLTDNLNKLVKEFQMTTGTEIIFSAEGDFSTLNDDYIYAIYRGCHEYITNAVRHGKAQRIVIILRNNGYKVYLTVIDDGIGCKEIVKGFGLNGMEQRMDALGGSITYSTDEESGFSINMEIPVQMCLDNKKGTASFNNPVFGLSK